MKDPDITGSPMKERVKETKKSTAMTDRKIVELSVTDTIRAKVIEKEGLLRTLMKEEDIDREEMSRAEEHIEINLEIPPEKNQGEEPIEIILVTSLEIETDSYIEKAEIDTVGKKKTGSPTMEKGDSERVARSP